MATPLKKTLDWKLKLQFLSKRTMHEPINDTILRRIDNILDDPNFGTLSEELTKYKQSIKPRLQSIEVPYIRRHNNLGRSFIAKDVIGWTNMKRSLRNTIIKGEVYDIDMICAQPNILRQICENEGWDFSVWSHLIEHRTDFIRIVGTEYGVNEKQVKQLITTLMFGGSLASWKATNNITKEDPTEFAKGCKDLRDEITEITGKIKLENLELFATIKRQKAESGEAWENENGSFLANYLQHQECIIIDHAMNWLDQHGYFDYQVGKKQLKAGSYEFDGFKLWREIVEKRGQPITEVVDELNEVIKSTFGLHIQFKIKDLDDVLPEINVDRQRATPATKEPKKNKLITPEYLAWKHHFEEVLGWCKIIQTSNYVRKYYEDGEYLYLQQKNQQEMINGYKHDKYECDDGTYSYISTWIDYDIDIKVYEKMDCIPHDKSVPDHIFNTWTPFAMETITEWTHDQEYVDFWIRHFKILCGNDEEVTEYFLDFIGQMIKYPSLKSGVAIDFISEQGAGKNTIFELCKIMLGPTKVFGCSDPARDIWGQFNTPMKDAIFVLINELSKKDTIVAEGKIKDWITEPTFTLSQKGIPQVVMPSMHRFISFQNNDNGDAGKRTKNGDRRNLIIRSSDELVGNKPYFEDLYNNKLTDINGIKSFYEYLKTRPRIDTFHRIRMPTPEYQENLKEANRCPLELFMIDYTTKHHTEEEIPVLASNLFDAFKLWKTNNDVSYDVNAISFGIRLKNLKIGGFSKGIETNKGKKYILNIPQLKEHYNIGCVVDLPEDNDEVDEEH